ncbi:MAG: exo-alpha-sialidase, partial [Phycisphaerales bacterium]
MLSKTVHCVVMSLGVVLAIASPDPAAAMDWSSAEPLYAFAATDTDSDYYTHWAHDGDGNWVCVWCAAIPGSTDRDFDILVSLSSDGGATWTDPAILDPFADAPPEIEDDFHPNVYADGAGHWIAVWYSHDNHGGTIGDDTDILVSRSTDNGQTWTSSVPLNSDAGVDAVGDSTPDLVYAGGSTWVAVWHRMSAPDTGDYD